MDIIHNLSYGFSIGLEPINLLFCFFGALLGTLIGVLPGIGPIGAMAMLLPVTFRLPPTAAIIMLAGIYYGSMYGGSTTAILVNIPGEAASITTCLDGHQMAKQGRAGPALGVAAFGSFISGSLGIIGLTFFAVPLTRVALKFGPPEYFALLLLGLNLVIYLSHGSLIKAIIMGAVGIILSCIGIDPIHGSPRMTFNLMQLWDGVDLIAVAMGLFGISDILVNMEQTQTVTIAKTKIKSFFPTIADWMQSIGAILRGTVIGFFLGILPGGGTVIASLLSYSVEKRVSKTPERFGKGAIEGVAGPESANNSATAGNFVPLLTLGIPPNVTMALMFGAFLIHGLRPGPLLLVEHPDVFWGVVCSMYIGNVMLLILNIPLIPLWVQVLKVPDRLLYPLIVLFCIVGAYSMSNRVFDVVVMFVFGLVGYLFTKVGYEAAPLALTLVIGPMIETKLRQSLVLSNGSFLIFFTRPVSAACIILAMIFFINSFFHYFRKVKEVNGHSAKDVER